jgi:hypothetical protein
MDPTTTATTTAGLVERLGFPIAIAVVAFAIVGALAWSLHRFTTGRFSELIDRCVGALTDSAAADREVSGALDRLSSRIEDCPARQASRWPLRHQEPAEEEGRVRDPTYGTEVPR